METETATQQIFYVILEGHDPENNDTDNRVKWVAANSRRQVYSFIGRNNLFPIVHEIALSGQEVRDNDGIDVFLEGEADSPWPSRVCTGERWVASQGADCWKALFPSARCCHLQNGAELFNRRFEEAGVKSDEGLTVILPVSHLAGCRISQSSLDKFGILQGHFTRARIDPTNDQQTLVTILSEFRHLYEHKNTRACGHPKCGVSTGICDSSTFGRGELDSNGYWEIPCSECARQHERLLGEKSWPFEGSTILEKERRFSDRKTLVEADEDVKNSQASKILRDVEKAWPDKIDDQITTKLTLRFIEEEGLAGAFENFVWEACKEEKKNVDSQ